MIRHLDNDLAFSRDLLKQMYDSFQDSIHPKAAIFIYTSPCNPCLSMIAKAKTK